jgi:hypothetical protein
MLRINLLPAYIAERKKTQLAWWLAGGTAALLCAIPAVYALVVQSPAYSKILGEATEANATADQTRKAQADATEERSKIDPIKKKVEFVKNVQYYNTLPGQIYRNAARYTDKDVEYNSMQVAGDTLQISAFVPSLENYGRFFITLFQNPDVKGVSVKGLQGWPSQQAGSGTATGATGEIRRGFPVAVTAQLKGSVLPPAPPVSPAGGGAGGGFGGMMGGGGMSGSMGGGMMGGGGMRGGGASMGGPPAGMGGKGMAADG